MTNTQELYSRYTEIAQKAADFEYASAVLGWDQEVYMPPKGVEYRGRQIATLAGQAHELKTSDDFGAVLKELAQRTDLSDEQKDNVRISLEDYEKDRKLPSSFVEQLSRQTSICYDSWLKARKENKYSLYAADLAKMIDLKRQEAKLFGYEGHIYNALLDEYEKGATVAMLDPVFEMVKAQLPAVLSKISSAAQVSDAMMYRHYPKQQQWDFSIAVLKQMGYDFEAGRQDFAEHPFTTSFAATDVRVTTRVDEDNFASLLWSSIHEGGHALYEQGLPEAQYGLPLGAAASLAIHESQSRLWENCVGRGNRFWKYFYPKLQGYFPQQLADVTSQDFYKAMNKVEPSLIRTEADEITYHFHVLIRYEIEKALISGELEAKGLDAVWNEQYKKYLGVSSPDDKQGVLQDVHWSHGMFGYFPTYSLGSFYAAQFFRQASKEMNGLNAEIEQGQFGNLLHWLREKIHRHGQRYVSEELCRQITGEGLNFNYFLQYIQDKYAGVYGINAW